MGSRDCAGWGALLANDWTVTHVDAQIITKAQALEICRTGPAITSTMDQLAVRSYGDMAVVTGRTVATTAGADPVSVRLRFTDVCVRQRPLARRRITRHADTGLTLANQARTDAPRLIFPEALAQLNPSLRSVGALRD
jgi:Domain of unknown function (DUF4440)